MKSPKFYLSLISMMALSFESIYAEEETNVPPKKKETRNATYSLLLKRQDYKLTPYEYTSYTEKTDPTEWKETRKLNQNSKILIPFVFGYENLESLWKWEISYFEMETVNPNAMVVSSKQSVLNADRHYFSPNARSEAEANVYKIFMLNEGWSLSLGGGIRNINRYIYGNYLSQGAFQEYFFTYGPQISLKTSYEIMDRLQMHFGLDVFYTQGNRFVRNTSVGQESLTFAHFTAGAQGVYRGYEADISLSYRFHENMKFHWGYNWIESQFSYLNLRQIDTEFTGRGNVFENSNQIALTRIRIPVRSGNFETLKGMYFAVSIHY